MALMPRKPRALNRPGASKSVAVDERWAALRDAGVGPVEAWAQARREVAEATAASASTPVNGKPPAPKYAPPSAWQGRPPISPAEAVRWAVEHVEQRQRPRDAPSGAAWTLYLLGREDRGALVQLWARACLGRGPVAD